MVKAQSTWPCPEHVAWPSYFSGACGLPDPNSSGHSAYLNPSTYIFPAASAFPGFTAPTAPGLKTEQANEVREFLQYPDSEPYLKETHSRGAVQNANPAPFQKKFLIFDQSGSNTRLFYSPVQSPIVTATQFAQAHDVSKERWATTIGQKHLPKYSLPEESDKDHIVNEGSEMHEDTEEINALLYSDDSGSEDDDEVTSTCRSPLAAKRTFMMQEQFEDTKEKIASSDWPNKRHKLIGGGYKKFPSPVDSAISARLNETCEYVSDAESRYSSDQVCSMMQTEEDDSIAGDIQLKKDKIRESLRVLENLIPGAKGKHPLLVIDETIDYLTSLMS